MNQELECEDSKYRLTYINLEQINELLDSLSNLNTVDCQSEAENLCQKFFNILDEYQDQSFLLDPCLQSIIDKLIAIIVDVHNAETLVFHVAFKFLYHITKVRGYKTILRYLPHEVSHLEIVTFYLSNEGLLKSEHWQTRFMLLIWLSILVLLPFHLKVFDANIDDDGSLMDKIYKLLLEYLAVPAKDSDAAAFCTAKFLTRPEIGRIYLGRFINWAIEQNVQAKNSSVLTLSYIFKYGRREDVNEYGYQLLDLYIKSNINENYDSLNAKYIVKLVQRIALSFLKVKVANWRYQRGYRSLLDNFERPEYLDPLSPLDSEYSTKTTETYIELDIDDELVEKISLILDFLLSVLRHKNTNVRWAGAKGIGRITERLPLELAEDVIGNILELFDYLEQDTAWHGACLTLAELGRRGLLLPNKLPNVVTAITKALIYDEIKGNFSAGKIVRDAACYVCWSFSRAFDPCVIKPFVDSIASTLVVVALFDREINCRRAASAAFQENVGRQGCFPNGAHIVTIIEPNAIAQLSKSYLDVSKRIVSYPAYTIPIITHLINYKVKHWDFEIRRLASMALHNVTLIIDTEVIIDHTLAEIELMLSSSNFRERQGAMFALAEITDAIYKKQEKISPEIIDIIANIVFELEEKNYFVGNDGDQMRFGICKLIEKSSNSKIKFNKEDELILKWTEILKYSLCHSDSKLRDDALKAFPTFCDQYFSEKKLLKEDFITFLLSKIKNGNDETKSGALSAISRIPDSILYPETPTLIISSILTELNTGNLSDKKLALIRSKAITAIADFIRYLDKIRLYDMGDIIKEFFNFCIKKGLTDFTRSSMRDIGIYMRQEAITALSSLSTYFVRAELYKNMIIELEENILSLISMHCVSPQDVMRNLAGKSFFNLINILPTAKNDKELHAIFEDVSYFTDFKDIKFCYKTFIQLAKIDLYRHRLIKGYVLSTGALQQCVAEESKKALLSFLHSLDTSSNEYKNICTTFLELLLLYNNDDLFTINILKTYAFLINSGVLDPFDIQINVKVFNAVWKAINKTDDVKKICAGNLVLCHALRFTEIQRELMLKLVTLLCSRYPVVRSSAANNLYNSLLVHNQNLFENDKDKLNETLLLLSQTDWVTNNSLELKKIRKIICDNMNIRNPEEKEKKIVSN